MADARFDSELEEAPEDAPDRLSLGDLLGVLSGISLLSTVVGWLPGLGLLLLVLTIWFLPAAIVLSVLILLQWPLMALVRRATQTPRAFHIEAQGRE